MGDIGFLTLTDQRDSAVAAGQRGSDLPAGGEAARLHGSREQSVCGRSTWQAQEAGRPEYRPACRTGRVISSISVGPGDLPVSRSPACGPGPSTPLANCMLFVFHRVGELLEMLRELQGRWGRGSRENGGGAVTNSWWLTQESPDLLTSLVSPQRPAGPSLSYRVPRGLWRRPLGSPYSSPGAPSLRLFIHSVLVC